MATRDVKIKENPLVEVREIKREKRRGNRVKEVVGKKLIEQDIL